MFQTTGVLSARPPFDFSQSLKFLSRFAPAMGQQIIAQQTLTKAYCFDGQPVMFRVSASGANQLAYTLYCASALSAADQARVAADISFFLSLDDDLEPFYQIGRDDAAFAPVIDQLYGYHQLKFSLSAFENACWAILSQRIALPVARKIKQRFAEQFGASLVVDGVAYLAFPEAPEVLGRLEEFDAVVGNLRKAEYLRGAAQAFALIDENWLRTAPYEEVENWLLKIKGIGAWSATFILLRGLGRVDHVPVLEERTLDAMRQHYGELTQTQIQQIAAQYGSYQGYWIHYLRAAG